MCAQLEQQSTSVFILFIKSHEVSHYVNFQRGTACQRANPTAHELRGQGFYLDMPTLR
ncbi:unnamed protein product, partial [Nesidiocoris tenuis]